MMKVTKQERNLILDMLASGKINVDEARGLFDAIEQCIGEQAVEEQPEEDEFTDEWIPDPRYEFLHESDSIRIPDSLTR